MSSLLSLYTFGTHLPFLPNEIQLRIHAMHGNLGALCLVSKDCQIMANEIWTRMTQNMKKHFSNSEFVTLSKKISKDPTISSLKVFI